MSCTPQRVQRWGARAFAFSGTLALGILAAWAFELLPKERPILVLMVFLVALATATGAAMVAVAASCHLTIARAFSAGVRAGQANAWPPVDAPHLRLVE